MTNQTETPRIYVACLAAYNAEILHGKWIDLDGDLDDLWNKVNAMLKASPIEDAEEWAIHDYEGFGFSLSEYEGFENVQEYAEFIEENGEIGKLLLGEYCGDIEHSKNILENYMGCYTSIADYAQELSEETTQIHDHLQYYIDYEKMGREMGINGEIIAIEEAYQQIHLFHNC